MSDLNKKIYLNIKVENYEGGKNKMVNKVNLQCKLITPMFMAGADRRTPELRPSEFKGMMRWWWRAIKAEDDINKLKKDEAEIFGGTGEGEGRSKIKLRLIYSDLQQGSDLKNDFKLKWQYNKKERLLTGENSGIGYLFYSVTLPNKERFYLKPGQIFYIEISSLDEKAFKNAIASLWVSIYLSGFGTRARRGGGNVEIISVNGNISELDFICKATNEEELGNWLKNNLNKAKNLILIQQSENGTNKYTNLKSAKILIFKGKNNWEDALNFIGKKYKNFRNKYRSQIFHTAAFGMPVIHNRFTVRMVPYENNYKNLSDRWATPLIFKIIKSNHLYFPVIIKLSAGGVSFVGKEKKQNRKWVLESIQNFDEELISEFLSSFKNKLELSYE